MDFEEPHAGDHATTNAIRSGEPGEIFGGEVRAGGSVPDRDVGQAVEDEWVGHLAVVVASVEAAALDEASSSDGVIDGDSTMTVRVLVDVGPFWSVAT